MNLPIADNPEHVDNLASIALLKAQGFTGPDASLWESLFEYGIAHRRLPDGEWLFVYRIAGTDEEDSRFDRCTFKSNLDPLREWKWVDWEAIRFSVGGDENYPTRVPLPLVIQELLSYYGTEEIFGTSYWEGFTIA